MPAPLPAQTLLEALRAEGANVVEHPGWRTHNRNHRGAWGPVNGIMIHHTVSTGSASSVALCRNGYTELPGPLCHAVIDKAGTVHLIGHGRTNHAGLGDGDVLDAVVAESSLSAPRRNDTDGNAHFYGFECVNLGDGRDPWPEAQLDAIERASAALCRAHGWQAASVIGHKEWTGSKVDPRGFTMESLRARIAARLSATPTRPTPPSGGSGGSGGSGNGTRYAPFPGAAFFQGSPSSPVVTAMGRRLVAEGCSAYSLGPGPQWSEADRRSYAKWQRKLGFRGADADGWPGRASWDALKVPAN
ncbi:peptidoglycan-binding protein [Streptomyces sp. H27-S2]|uniref:peptidoglycan-binding protein n=1 Tax=Streptomyces antarcticus TaxID=2996458 RepID=UPI00226E2B82|nr:peptidoglycan-binding protein [Streptomyces sp. H27-S2]MCY0953848.1 peptidoglycan-binding protein [Streptomyces sp. H27-S2]